MAHQVSGLLCASWARLAEPPAPAYLSVQGSPRAISAPAHEQQLSWLTEIVGSERALMSLTDQPLAAREPDFHQVPEEIRDRARSLVSTVHEVSEFLLDAEFAEAARRLAVLAISRSAALARNQDDAKPVAAALWAALKVNDLVGNGRVMRVKDVAELCGLKTAPSSLGQSWGGEDA